jgi:hypothetical protein
LVWRYVGALLTGVVIGFLGGLFGKGGSAVATPLLSLLGFPGFIAVASPLPATVPSTVVSSTEYWRSRLIDWEIFWWSVGIGTPAIVGGSFLSHQVGSRPLLILTGVLVLGFGISFLFFPKRPVPRDRRGREPGGAEAVLLDSTDGERRNGGRLCFGLACERGGIPPGPVLHQYPEAAYEKSVCLLSGCVLHPGDAGDDRSCLSGPYFLGGRCVGCSRRDSVRTSGSTTRNSDPSRQT